MKQILCLIWLSAMAHATIIYVDSQTANTLNTAGKTMLDSPPPEVPLTDSEWLTFQPGFFSPPDGISVFFGTFFMLNGGISAANLIVLSTEPTSVFLNGHELTAATTDATFTSAQLDPYLHDGFNTLIFGVEQVRGVHLGLDYAGSVNDGPTPEPGTVTLLSAGLIGLAALRRRR